MHACMLRKALKLKHYKHKHSRSDDDDDWWRLPPNQTHARRSMMAALQSLANTQTRRSRSTVGVIRLRAPSRAATTKRGNIACARAFLVCFVAAVFWSVSFSNTKHNRARWRCKVHTLFAIHRLIFACVHGVHKKPQREARWKNRPFARVTKNPFRAHGSRWLCVRPSVWMCAGANACV